MLCTNITEQECVARGLFGDRKWRLDYLREIRPGDIGFLLNLTTNELIGVFVARSDAQLDIEGNAWFGEFRAQVRVDSIGGIRRLGKAGVVLRNAGVVLDRLSTGALIPLVPVQNHDVEMRLLRAFDTELQPGPSVTSTGGPGIENDPR